MQFLIEQRFIKCNHMLTTSVKRLTDLKNVLFEKGKDTFLCILGLAINSKAATLKCSKKF